VAFSHGSNAVMTINSVDLSEYINSTSQEMEAETAEVTTLGKTAKNYIPGLEDGTISADGPFDPALDAAIDAMRRTLVPFVYQPQGTASGLPKYTGNCILTSYSIETPVDDAGSWEAEWQISDGWVRGTNT
jgi:hypothetical protein